MVQMLGAYREEGVSDLGAALEDLTKPLKQAIKALHAEDDLLSVCECLHQAPHHALLEYAATHALEHHQERPLFVYFQIFGRAKGSPHQVKDRDFQRLEVARERAATAKDHRAKLLIERFLDQGLFRVRPATRSRLGHLTEMNQLREVLEQLPPPLRDRLLDELMDELPIDADNLPPEAREALLKALLLGGGNLADLLDAPDFPLPPPDRSQRKKRRS
ncbi:MAG: hypothetical protein R3F44_03780 [Candidatus Competibacteraceae bacterium]